MSAESRAPEGTAAETLLRAQKHALELAVHGSPLPVVLAALATALENHFDRRLFVSILLLDRDGAHLRHGAAPSLPEPFNAAIDGIEIGEHVGSCGTAAFGRKPVIVTDIQTDPLWCNFRELAGEHGLAACWSTPILSPSGALLGTFALYYRTPQAPRPEEHEVVDLLTHTAALIIERERSREALQASAERYRLVSERDRFLIRLDDVLRPLVAPEQITLAAATLLGEHLQVGRCAYATVEEDEDTFDLTGNYTGSSVRSIVGRYRFRQFGEECLRSMRAGEPYVVADAEADARLTAEDRASYALTQIRAVICVPIVKAKRFVAAMAVHGTAPRVWSDTEVKLVEQVASRSWESIERTRLTATLRESENQFRQLANSIANLAWMAKPEGWIYWYNEQWYRYTGTTPSEMEGWGWTRVHDPEVLDSVLVTWKHSIETGQPFEMVFPIRGADGTFRRFLTRVNPVRNSLGEVVHWFGTNTDVENERRAVELLLTSEQERSELLRREQLAREDAELQKRLLHSLFMQAPTLIAVLRGREFLVELANPRVCEVWGHPFEAMKDRPLLEVLPELRTQNVGALLEHAFDTGEPCVGVEASARLRRPGGAVETVYFNFVYSPFRNLLGEIEGIFVIASDVTAQVVARQETDALRHAAESANRAKDEFLAILGHELRNPLSPILTALQLMRLKGDGGERERTVIERQVNYLTRLIDDLLDVSRIAQGKVDLKRELLQMGEIVSTALELASPLMEQRAHRVELDVPQNGLCVAGDPTRLTQVVSNLLTNAAKYTPAGGLISVSAVAEGGGVLLQVRDTGVGISAETLPHVFELFVQEKQAIDRAGGGLGLGLTIVRSLVQRHGGRVAARSDGLGKGSEFSVWLPAVTTTIEDAPAAEGEAGLPAAPRGRRILVVDDNEDGAAMLSAVLSTMGHQTHVAYDAPAALEIAQSFSPEIALLDIGLPVMDGYELATRLKALPGLSSVRLIALTGYGQESDRARTRAAGFHHHLVKPVDFQTLLTVLREQ